MALQNPSICVALCNCWLEMPPEAGLDDDLGTQTIDTGLSSGQSGGHPALLTYYYAHKTWT